MNACALVAVPEGVVTEMAPVVAPVGTVVLIWLSETTVNVAGVALNLTAVAPVKAVPVMVTAIPGDPDVGENEVIAGAPLDALTVNDCGLVPVPTAFVTAIGPVVAPAGTVAVI